MSTPKKTLFVYDSYTKELAQAISQNYHFTFCTCQQALKEDFSNLSSAVIASNDELSSLLNKIHNSSLPAYLWSSNTSQMLEIIDQGYSLPQILLGSTLKAKFRQIIHNPSGKPIEEIPEGKKLAQQLKEIFNEKQPLLSLVSTIKHANLSLTLSLSKNTASLIPLFLTSHQNIDSLKTSGQLFENKWFKIISPQKRKEYAPLANICLNLLEADALLKKLPRYYRLKTYWSLYSQGPEIIPPIINEMEENLEDTTGLPSNAAAVLCLKGDIDSAKDLILKENFQNLSDPKDLHIAACFLAYLGFYEKSVSVFSKISGDFFTSNDPLNQKLFYQALAYKAFRQTSLSEKFLQAALSKDRMIQDKLELLDKIEPPAGNNFQLPEFRTPEQAYISA